MYKVLLNPNKCKRDVSWIKGRKDGDILDICDNQYEYHKDCGCMDVIEHYKIITLNKESCVCCGQEKTIRKKIIIM